MTDIVRCPICDEKGESSAVRLECTTGTLVAVQHLYDEEGRLHIHDPNTLTHRFVCAEGHTWQTTQHHACWCGWPPARERPAWATPTLTPYPWPEEKKP